MSSKIQISPVAAAAALSSVKTTNGTIGTAESLFSSVKVLRQVERESKKASSTISQLSSIYENHYQNQKHSFQDKEVSNKTSIASYDVSKKSTPSTNNNNAADSIYQTKQQTKLTPQHAGVSVENLIPQAARLILANSTTTNNAISEQPDSVADFGDQDSGDDYDYVVTDDTTSDSDELIEDNSNHRDTNNHRQRQPNIPPPDYDDNNFVDDFRDSYVDYGLEVIQEETESQMSSDSDQELDPLHDEVSSSRNRKLSSTSSSGVGTDYFDLGNHYSHRHFVGVSDFGGDSSDILGYTNGTSGDDGDSSHHHDDQDSQCTPGEILTKHIRISAKDFDPEPILQRLYHVSEPHHKQNSADGTGDTIAGHMNILSGNRKKGTFWNAWKKKFWVVGAGKLNGYEKDDCQDLFQSINLIGGKVDFLDPVEFVGPEHGKGMTNRIIGVDDGKGHYFVLQCTTPEVARQWVQALEQEMASTLKFAVPILPKSPSLFRDIILVDIGSSNVRAGVLTHQPTLPALFFASVMSENLTSGKMVYGNDVYKPDYRKNAKITFPFECTSKMCQNIIEVKAVEGFLKKIFKSLNVRPENYRLILNLPRRVDNKCRTSILDLLFNTFQIRSVMIAHQSVVAFWAYSTDNGIVCDVGERCDIVPVSQGFILSQAWSRAPYGGQPLKHSLRQGLGPQENGLYLSTPAENLVLRFISENFVCVGGSPASSRRPSQDSQEITVEMDLRDVLSFSNLIGVNQNVLRGVGEGFFDPGLYGFDCDSLPKMIFKCIQTCGVDIRKEMSQNILLVGGCTMIPGFPERLESELVKLCPPHLKPKVNVSPYRYHGSFIGSSVLATTEAFEKSLLHRSKYDGGPGPAFWMI